MNNVPTEDLFNTHNQWDDLLVTSPQQNKNASILGSSSSVGSTEAFGAVKESVYYSAHELDKPVANPADLIQSLVSSTAETNETNQEMLSKVLGNVLLEGPLNDTQNPEQVPLPNIADSSENLNEKPEVSIRKKRLVKKPSTLYNSLIPKPVAVNDNALDPLSMIAQQANSPPIEEVVQEIPHVKQAIQDTLPEPSLPPAIEPPVNEPVEEGTFSVEIVDPSTVTDIVGGHTEYKIIFRANASWIPFNEATISRRYRDFLLLFQTLVDKHPGLIVPAIPEKTVLGRFQQELIESRRIALTSFLIRCLKHKIIRKDQDLHQFLSAQSWEIDEKKENRGILGFISDTILSSPKKNLDRQQKLASIDGLEERLKNILRALEVMVKQRNDLGLACAEFSETIFGVGQIQTDETMSSHLMAFADVHKRMKALYELQSKNDFENLVFVIDEYLRTIASVRLALEAKARAQDDLTSHQQVLEKKQDQLQKIQANSRVRTDKIQELQQEIEDIEKQIEGSLQEFRKIDTLVNEELARFEAERTRDFEESINSFFSAIVQTQKEIVNLWQNFVNSLKEDTESL